MKLSRGPTKEELEVAQRNADRLASHLWPSLFPPYLYMDEPKNRLEDPTVIEGEFVEVVPEERRLMGFDPGDPRGDVTVMSVSLVSDPLPPYGQIRVLPSSSPTDSPRPTS